MRKLNLVSVIVFLLVSIFCVRVFAQSGAPVKKVAWKWNKMLLVDMEGYFGTFKWSGRFSGLKFYMKQNTLHTAYAYLKNILHRGSYARVPKRFKKKVRLWRYMKGAAATGGAAPLLLAFDVKCRMNTARSGSRLLGTLSCIFVAKIKQVGVRGFSSTLYSQRRFQAYGNPFNNYGTMRRSFAQKLKRMIFFGAVGTARKVIRMAVSMRPDLIGSSCFVDGDCPKSSYVLRCIRRVCRKVTSRTPISTAKTCRRDTDCGAGFSCAGASLPEGGKCVRTRRYRRSVVRPVLVRRVQPKPARRRVTARKISPVRKIAPKPRAIRKVRVRPPQRRAVPVVQRKLSKRRVIVVLRPRVRPRLRVVVVSRPKPRKRVKPKVQKPKASSFGVALSLLLPLSTGFYDSHFKRFMLLGTVGLRVSLLTQRVGVGFQVEWSGGCVKSWGNLCDSVQDSVSAKAVLNFPTERWIELQVGYTGLIQRFAGGDVQVSYKSLEIAAVLRIPVYYYSKSAYWMPRASVMTTLDLVAGFSPLTFKSQRTIFGERSELVSPLLRIGLQLSIHWRVW